MGFSQNDELELTTVIQQAFKDFHEVSVVDSAFQQLALFRATKRKMAYSSDRQVINEILCSALDRLEHSNATYAAILRMRFLETQLVSRVATHLHVAESNVYAQQRTAIRNLAEIIEAQERQLRSQLRQRLATRLPVAFHHELVGVADQLEQMIRYLQQPGSPWCMSIEGLGGIGKTALADALLRQVIELGLFEEFGWLSVQSVRLNMAGEMLHTGESTLTADDLVRRLLREFLPGVVDLERFTTAQAGNLLQEQLRAVPHFIVIDNLETVTDLEVLLPFLQRLANPSKFLITTRESLHGRWDVFPVTMSELRQTDALDLVRQVAANANLPNVAAADDHTLQPIYETVGGNPLALRLVVGQLHYYSLPIIIHDLREAQGLAIDNLYTFIYGHAWASLDELSRHALLAMIMLPVEGDTWEFLEGICQLTPNDLRASLQRLTTLNLVDVRGDLHQRIYSIHSLTRTFLLEQVAKWR